MTASFTERNPCSEASSTSAIQKILRILQNMKVYYMFHKETLFPMLNKSTASHCIRYTIILSFHLFPGLPGNLFTFPHQYMYEVFFYSTSDKCLATLPLLCFVIQRIFSEKVLLWSYTLSSFLHSPVPSPSEEENICPASLLLNLSQAALFHDIN